MHSSWPGRTESGNQALADSALEVTPVSRLSVAGNSDLVPCFIPKLCNFLKRYPDIELRIHTQRSSNALRMVQSREIDLAIGHFLRVRSDMELHADGQEAGQRCDCRPGCE